MKILIIAVVGVVALGGIVTLIGFLLPVKHTATRSAVFQIPPEKIWGIVTDFKNYPNWRADVKTVEVLPSSDGKFAWLEKGSNGDIPYRTVEALPNQRLVVRIASDKLPFGGQWIYSLQPRNGGTELSLTEEGEVYNPIFRFMSRFVFGHASTLENYLKALSQRVSLS